MYKSNNSKFIRELFWFLYSFKALQNQPLLMQNLYSTKDFLLSREDKEKLLNQKGICIWLTGLSGSGKTTIANYVSRQLHDIGIYTQVLDGDNIR